jgi:hypothetical protein
VRKGRLCRIFVLLADRSAGRDGFFHDAWSEKCEIFRKQKFVFFRCQTQKKRELLGATFHSPPTKKKFKAALS